MSDTDAVNVSIFVDAEPPTAFRVFTDEINQWWKPGRIYRTSAHSKLYIEPKLGGRLLDVHNSNGQAREIGKVLSWEPGEHLQFEWRGINFKDNDTTYVDVHFAAEDTGTRVHVRHWGWSTLADDHPVRHGKNQQQFIAAHSRWWANLLYAFKQGCK